MKKNWSKQEMFDKYSLFMLHNAQRVRNLEDRKVIEKFVKTRIAHYRDILRQNETLK